MIDLGSNHKLNPVIRMAKKTTQRKSYSAPALDKGLDIIELLSNEPDGLILSDIALKLNRSISEIFRMLAVLERRAYISLDPATDRYALTLKIFEISHRYLPIKRLTSAALPVMQKLATQLEQSCHLVIYYNGRGVIIAQAENPAPRSFNVRLGAEAPLTNSCSGHLLLAYADPKERTEMLKAQPRHLKTKVSKSELNEIIAKITSQGYESIASTQIQGVKDIGYPIFDYSKKMVAALSIPFLKHLDDSQIATFDDARLVLQDAAHTISFALGYSR